MRNDQHLITDSWSDYELLDSGDTMKLERFGEIIVSRPETQALWHRQRPELWDSAHASFVLTNGKGAWITHKPIPASWNLSWGTASFNARLTGFKHIGIFPEQAPNWAWARTRVASMENPHILNLFGYTGIATVVAAEAGATVTHVDASKQSLDWAHENARLSHIPENSVRWMLDDALGLVKREVRRESHYDGVILDPPTFGRGAKGEVWKIEDSLLPLLQELKKLLGDTPGTFFLMNGYAAGYASRSFSQMVESVFGKTQGESGELHIKESASERVLPAGIYVRFVR